MKVLHVITILGIPLGIPIILAMHCYEEMNYHEKYSYGYDISCSNLNHATMDEIRNATVYNEIRLTISDSDLTQLTPSLLENIPKTREIIITNSKMDFAHARLFGDLKQLEVLRVTWSNISGEVSQDLLKGLDNLRELNLSHNRLSGFKRGSLKHVEDLEELDLSANRFGNLNQVPLCETERLQRLFLQRNHLTRLNDSIRCLKLLKILIVDFNHITELVTLSQLPDLTRISLSYNQIEDLGHALEGLNKLDELNLEGNKLRSVHWNYFRGATKLRRLNLKNNRINRIDQDSFNNLTILEELNLQNNNLSTLPIFDLKSLKTLYLSNNNLSVGNQEFRYLPNLKFLALSHCNIRKLTKNQFQNLNYLQTLDLSHNKLLLTTSSFSGLHSLTNLYLNFNSFLTLPNYTFQFVANLRLLDLSNNKLKKLDHLTFHNLKTLETLNLSSNHLETLSENVLLPLEGLKILDLEGNRLRHIDYDIIISLLSNLKLINIRDNELSCEFLSEMLQYFRYKKINFTINEKLSYNEENVAGILCHEFDQLNDTFKYTDAVLVNDSAVLNEIYHIAKDDNKSLTASLNTTLLILSLVVFVLVVTVVAIAYRIYVVVKRRNFVTDEIELLDARVHKWNNNNV